MLPRGNRWIQGVLPDSGINNLIRRDAHVYQKGVEFRFLITTGETSGGLLLRNITEKFDPKCSLGSRRFIVEVSNVDERRIELQNRTAEFVFWFLCCFKSFFISCLR